ncbi:MAG: tail fiber protein [Gammaproteobacteria bacterium]|jgi:microcystin-dependent protein|nr:tail fiber protein [uncultured Shewanella sp.]MBU1393391.1 tail fiber protein [Gammaproteobacteria bacterium]QYX64939.1 tail fiber protein [Shewanella putrefaciens]MBU1479564.1 tail fiber protein [Gammaproteobacteria bacterium]MBU2000777.1 tail fiber protein [Gammaproteobacteria bacterium]MBU2131300.1 tail fiber protein [Gammaproteobacteria bacterium]
MSDAYVGEIRQFPYSFAPYQYAYCAGQLIPIQQNTALFSLLGVNYGGNGSTNFALPNLQGNALMQQGIGPGLTPRDLGETGGSTSVTLFTTELPNHNHLMTVKMAGLAGVATTAAGSYLSVSKETASASQKAYSNAVDKLVSLAPTMLGLTGGGQSHENRQPFIAIPFCIALYGIFPPRN